MKRTAVEREREWGVAAVLSCMGKERESDTVDLHIKSGRHQSEFT